MDRFQCALTDQTANDVCRRTGRLSKRVQQTEWCVGRGRARTLVRCGRDDRRVLETTVAVGPRETFVTVAAAVDGPARAGRSARVRSGLRRHRSPPRGR